MSRFVEAESAIRQSHARYIDAVWRQDGRRAFTIGLYHERYRGDADRWRFTWRFFDLFYMGPADLSKPFLPIPDYGKPPWRPDPERAASPPASSIF